MENYYIQTVTLVTAQQQHMGRNVKNYLQWFANNKGADQPVHPHSLISTFVIPFAECIISKLATSAISFFYLVSIAKEIGLSLALSETPITGFLTSWPICC